MKRSQMLAKLYEATDTWSETNSSENLVDMILREVEDLGMLPPMQIHTVNKLNGTSVGKTVSLTWDKEDET